MEPERGSEEGGIEEPRPAELAVARIEVLTAPPILMQTMSQSVPHPSLLDPLPSLRQTPSPTLPAALLLPLLPAEALASLLLDGEDEWDPPLFAFHDLDYIPSGYSGLLAPYIETGPGTMRAATVLMNLKGPGMFDRPTLVCDLGCGDGEFLIGLLGYLNSGFEPAPRDDDDDDDDSTPTTTRTTTRSVHGLGVDYNPGLIATATLNAVLAHESAQWLVYDFNADEDDLFSQLAARGVTHVFVYLVPKQLALATVRGILEKLVRGGVVVCCHKFQPGYLVETRRDVLMDLVVYERALT